MAQYKLYTGGPYTQNNGSAITRTSTDINVGTAKNIRDSVTLNRVDWSVGSKEMPNVKPGVNGVGVAQTTAFLTVTSVDQGTGDLVQWSFGSPHGLVVGDVVVCTTDTGKGDLTEIYYRVVGIVSSTQILINKEHDNSLNGNAPTLTRPVGTIGVQGKDNFIMMRNDATVHGQANTKLASGASDYGRRKIAKFSESQTTVRIATSLRTSNRYNIYTGKITSVLFPTVAVDTLLTDDVTVDSTTKVGLKGELQYRAGGANPEQKDYTAKTN